MRLACALILAVSLTGCATPPSDAPPSTVRVWEPPSNGTAQFSSEESFAWSHSHSSSAPPETSHQIGVIGSPSTWKRKVASESSGFQRRPHMYQTSPQGSSKV